ncbi:hypothetical protein U5801_15705 [Lamprobacter modestohalophilus]|uniref:hypothetical protein n=1 Tax=Lamprobacter modestohalophilus TaxID=1064514 RepID=UPI002ADEE74C|nr:hypothetical protein [Lamprobacter modestohalophilus]MEA1051239.1 hypothetical protein [Lamprobacter modestohalophilus]
MNREFFPLAQRIAETAIDGGLSVSQLVEIATAQFGEINCYPGEPGEHCHRLALFVALHGQLRQGRGHYNCAQILEEMVRHLQGRCPGTTRHAVLILDAWWHDHYEKWRPNLETMKRDGVQIEAFLIGAGGWVAPIPI